MEAGADVYKQIWTAVDYGALSCGLKGLKPIQTPRKLRKVIVNLRERPQNCGVASKAQYLFLVQHVPVEVVSTASSCRRQGIGTNSAKSCHRPACLAIGCYLLHSLRPGFLWLPCFCPTVTTRNFPGGSDLHPSPPAKRAPGCRAVFATRAPPRGSMQIPRSH